MATSTTSKMTREDFKKQKLIEEQRKAGTMPAEVDPETGKDINPHIPHYISQAPWYLDVGHPTLMHQRTNEKSSIALNEWYDRGAKVNQATKYRKGACTNCGAMTHKVKDCVERPRKIGAKYTNHDIKPDEKIQDINLDFDAKRDRWNGYDPSEQAERIMEGELIEEERRRIREEQAKEKLLNKTGKNTDDEDDSSGDEDLYADNADMHGQKFDAKTRTTVRNLRIREDTAKYLLNLDLNSAHYDPKTRSQRENPLAAKTSDGKASLYANDNFVLHTGDSQKMAQLQAFAWEAASHNNIHFQANPSQTELLYKEYINKKKDLSNVVKSSILEKYGGDEYLKAPPKELLLAQTEDYVEYSQSTGKVIKGVEKAVAKSKYEEDVLYSNHTAVWGSYWHNFQWGYACCHSFTKSAYCTGQAGIEAARASQEMMQQNLEKANKDAGNVDSLMNKAMGVKLAQKKRLGEGEVVLDQEKLDKAMKNERKRKEVAAEETIGKKKKYNSDQVKDVTEEELEAYRLSKARTEDPMANYVDEED